VIMTSSSVWLLWQILWRLWGDLEQDLDAAVSADSIKFVHEKVVRYTKRDGFETVGRFILQGLMMDYPSHQFSTHCQIGGRGKRGSSI